VQLSSATNSDSETLAATPKAVKTAYDLANGKYTAQDATTARKG
ncbi:phage tail protein, partial [Escherichia coli]